MKKSTRIILFIASLSFVSLAVCLFRDFLLERILKPVAARLDILYRYAVLSQDQKFLWAVMIILSCLVLFFLLLRRRRAQDPLHDEPVIENFYSRRFEMWRLYLNSENPYSRSRLRKELTRILAGKYAVQKRLDIDYVLIDAFKNREIPIPDNIYRFLFAEEKKPPSGIKNLFYSWSGRKAADYDKNLKECLLFLEKFMELKDE